MEHKHGQAYTQSFIGTFIEHCAESFLILFSLKTRWKHPDQTKDRSVWLHSCGTNRVASWGRKFRGRHWWWTWSVCWWSTSEVHRSSWDKFGGCSTSPSKIRRGESSVIRCGGTGGIRSPCGWVSKSTKVLYTCIFINIFCQIFEHIININLPLEYCQVRYRGQYQSWWSELKNLLNNILDGWKGSDYSIDGYLRARIWESWELSSLIFGAFKHRVRR